MFGVDHKLLTKIWIDVFPYDLALGRDLEYPAIHTFADQRITVGQASGAGYEGTEKVPTGGTGIERRILPNDLLSNRIDFEYA